MAVSTFQVRRTVDRRRALARHACATRSSGRARSRRAQRPRRCQGVWLLFETTTSSLALARRFSRLARFDRRRHHLSSQVPCRNTRVRSFAGRHFELVRRGARGAAPRTTASETLPSHPKFMTKLRFLAVATAASCGAGAIPALFRVLFLCYACVIHALFMRYSCVILALFLRYSCVIPLLFWLYSFGYFPGTTPLCEPRRGRMNHG